MTITKEEITKAIREGLMDGFGTPCPIRDRTPTSLSDLADKIMELIEGKPEIAWEKRFWDVINVTEEYDFIDGEKRHFKRLELLDFIRQEMKELGRDINLLTEGKSTQAVKDSLEERGIKLED